MQPQSPPTLTPPASTPVPTTPSQGLNTAPASNVAPTTSRPLTMQPATNIVANTQNQPAKVTSAAAPHANQQPGTQVKPKNPVSTQNRLLISEIRDDMVVMTDGSFRALIACQSINFDLMSTTEQEGIELFFQGFLNSLYFPIQIFIRSQRVDMTPYIEYLQGLQEKQDNLLLINLMEDYIGFIDQISEEANIMKKSFFVVVEFNPFGDINSQTNSTKNLFSNLFSNEQPKKITISAQGFQKTKDEIESRTNTVINGLSQLGINSVRIKTKDLATVFYNIYNPDTAVQEPLLNYKDFINTYVSKGDNKNKLEVNGG